ncbi:MAG: transposase, partial [Actinomycetia bacterium]|nr:transposase [Actinomycetes bacterium]
MIGNKKIFWKFHERNDKKVARAVREGNTDTIIGTGWGFLDNFFCFLYSIRFLKIIDIKSVGYKRIMLPLVMLITTYSMKILLGISSMNKIPSLLFREIALLRMIGFTATQIKNGSCRRGKGKSIPINKNTLARMLSKLTITEVNDILDGAVQILAKKGFICGSRFILDATDIETTEKCEGRGVKKVKKRRYLKQKQEWIETEELIYGYKLIIIWEKVSRVIVAAKVVKIADHESKHTLALLAQAKRNIGKRKIRLLLIDNGFMDGKTLWIIKYKLGVNFIVRIRTNMHLASDARSFRDSPFASVGEDKGRGLKVLGIASLTTYDQYGDEGHLKNRYKKNFKPNLINCVMVTEWNGKAY